jgi:glycosyltransferase involved in cell wall biosynthesis
MSTRTLSRSRTRARRPSQTAQAREVRPRIVYIFQDQYPWDIRVEKITGSLADAGYETVIVSRNRSGLPTDETLRPGLRVRRLPGAVPLPLRRLLNFPAFFSPVWIWTVYRAAAKLNANLLIVRDLPLAPAAWLVGRILGIPVIMDMAENYPAMIQDTWDFGRPGRFDLLLRNPAMLRRLERWALRRMDGLLVVSNASRTRVCGLIDTNATPVWVVENTPRLAAAKTIRDSALSQRMKTLADLKLLYVGGLEETRGLAIVVEAMPLILERVGATSLVIVGEGTSRPALERRIKELGLEQRVILAGWLNHEFIPGVIAAADICLVPHFVTDHTDTTLPNKIYDYMIQCKPVVVTHSKSLHEIVETYGCGLSYQDKDPRALAHVVAALADQNVRNVMGTRGKIAIETHLNWTADAEKLIVAARQMVG